MKKEKINSLLIIGLLIFYMIAYCSTSVYSFFEGTFSVLNLIFIIILVINNKEEVLKDKKNILIILFLQVIQLFLCKIATNTGYGSLLQMFELTSIILMIPLIKTDLKFYKILRYLIPAFYIIFLLVDKVHLNTNYVGYILLCTYLIGIMTYNLDRKDKFWILLMYTILTLVLINNFKCRTAMLATVAFFALMSFPKKIYDKKYVKNSLPYLLTFGSLVFAGLYVLLWKTGVKIDLTFFANKSLFSGRNRIWSEAFPLLFQNPLFGLGSKYDLASFPAYALHNSVFMISLTFGLPNLIIFFYNFKKMLQKIYLSLQNNYKFKIVIASIIVLFFVDFFESYIYWSNFNFLFLFIAVLALNRNRNFNRNNQEFSSKKKIYIFEEGIDRMGGVERIISTLSNNFVSKYDIRLISFYKTRPTPYFDYDKRVKITYLTSQSHQRFLDYKHGSLVYYFFRILEEVKLYLFLYPKIAEVTSRIAEDDVVIFGRVEVAIRVLPYLDNCKKVITRDAIHYLYHRKAIKRKISKILPRKVSTLIVSSEESKNVYLKNMNCRDMEIVKIYNPLGINPNYSFNYNKKTIVSIGRYAKQKGFENLINAFKIVHEAKPDWKLQIVGTNHPKLEELVKNLKLKNNVKLINNNKDIVSVLNHSSIYVMASRYEGYANSLVEAMACGVPSITYNWLLGPDEIITNLEDGIIVKLNDRFEYAKGIDNYEDTENLARAILDLINDKEKCKSISEKASKKINETRNVDLILSQWEEVLNKL